MSIIEHARKITAQDVSHLQTRQCNSCGNRIRDRKRYLCDKCLAELDNMLQQQMEGMNEGGSVVVDFE